MNRHNKFSVFGMFEFLRGRMNSSPLVKNFNIRGLSPEDQQLAAEADRKHAARLAERKATGKEAARLRRERRAQERAENRARSIAGQQKAA